MVTPDSKDDSEIIKLAIPGQAEPLFFANTTELLTWIEQEQEFWKWLEKHYNQNWINELWNRSTSAWTQAREKALAFKKEQDTKKRQHTRDEIRNILTRVYSEDRYAMPSSLPQAKYVNSLKDEDPRQAAFVLLAFLRPHDLPSPLPAIGTIATLKALLFDLGLIEGAATAEKAALQQAGNEWQKLLSNSRMEQKSFTDTLGGLTAKYEDLLAARDAAFSEKIAEAEKRLKDIEATYDTKLALQAPVEYWDKKDKYHLSQAKSLAIHSTWIAGVLLTIVLGELVWLIQPLSQNPKLDYWRFGIVLATAAFLIWPLRIIVRIFYSNIHLREDAMERTTMAKTYLSLLRSNEALQDSDRKLVLEILFRPSTKGVVADEADTSIIQILSRLVSGK